MGQILFIVEGDKYEPKVLEYLWSALVPEYADAKVIYTFRTHIYTLYKELYADSDLSLIGLLNERNPGFLPDDCDEDTFQEIYLIFDYDGHVNMPTLPDGSGNHFDGDVIIAEMLQYFNDENGNGRLFINYPMVEAIKHLISTPLSPSDLITTKCKGPHCKNILCGQRTTCPPVKIYKTITNQAAPNRKDMTKISWAEWRDIFTHHLVSARIISSMPQGTGAGIAAQTEIFQSQLSYFISLDCPQVAVLSAFPLLFHYYLGAGLTSRLAGL